VSGRRALRLFALAGLLALTSRCGGEAEPSEDEGPLGRPGAMGKGGSQGGQGNEFPDLPAAGQGGSPEGGSPAAGAGGGSAQGSASPGGAPAAGSGGNPAGAPASELCGDSADNDGDGQVDEGCPPVCGDGKCNGIETCAICKQDCGECPPSCGDGKCNGSETCKICPGDCGACPAPPPEKCNDNVDNDGDGQIDEGCPTEIVVDPGKADCRCFQCPPEFPFIKSCSISFKANATDPSSNENCFDLVNTGTLYAMQGKNCGNDSDFQGRVEGSIVCGKTPGSCKISGAIDCSQHPSAGDKESYKNCK
jgi:hypothetical protein